MALNDYQKYILEDEDFQEVMDDYNISLEDIKDVCNKHQVSVLTDSDILDLIDGESLTIKDLVKINSKHKLDIISNEHVYWLIRDRFITIEQAFELDKVKIDALENPDIMLEIRSKQLDIKDIKPRINVEQSTHYTSIEESAAKSADRLNERYKNNNLQDATVAMKDFIEGLSDDSIKNIAAKRCIARMTRDNYKAIAKHSKIPIRDILALTYLAIIDSNVISCDLKDSQRLFIEGLHECECGDDGKPICVTGTFNKLISKLNGIHPDVHINVISQQQATWKLAVVVKKEAINYLSKQFANIKDNEKLIYFKKLVAKLEQDDLAVDSIYEEIKEKVADTIYEEFATLYESKDDPFFTSFIDAGRYQVIPKYNLTDLKNKITTFNAKTDKKEGLFFKNGDDNKEQQIITGKAPNTQPGK